MLQPPRPVVLAGVALSRYLCAQTKNGELVAPRATRGGDFAIRAVLQLMRGLFGWPVTVDIGRCGRTG
jgi:hypothetical protein